MKFSTAITFLVASAVASYHQSEASSNLRVHSSRITQEERVVSSSLQMKKKPNKMRGVGGNNQDHTVSNHVGVRGANSHLEKKVTDGHITSQLKLKYSNKDSKSNNHFGINIVGGEVSDAGEFPYYVDMNFCGATLIGPDIVLGAAHCGDDNVGLTVNIGGTRVDIIKHENNPSYNPNTMENDFALYQVESPIDLSNSDVILTLNTNSSNPRVGQDLTTLGKGLTVEGGLFPSFRLRDVVVPAVSIANCEAVYQSRFYPQSMICAGGEEGKDSCQGDSGGPLVQRNGMNHILTGVVSWGDGCGRSGVPGIYSKLSSAIGWIGNVACNSWKSSVNGLCNATNGNTDEEETVDNNNGNNNSNNGNNNNNTEAGTSAPTPTSAPGQVGGCTQLRQTEGGLMTSILTVSFRTDEWPEETRITLADNQGDVSWDCKNLEANENYSFTMDVPINGCTTLDVSDSAGDGLSSGGFVVVTYDTEIKQYSWDLGSGFTFTMGTSCP